MTLIKLKLVCNVYNPKPAIYRLIFPPLLTCSVLTGHVTGTRKHALLDKLVFKWEIKGIRRK